MNGSPNSTYEGLRSVPTITAYYTGSDTLYNGYCLAYDHDSSGTAADVTRYGATKAARLGRQKLVEKPSYNNLMAGGFAGVVIGLGPDGLAGNGVAVEVKLIPAWAITNEMEALTDQNVAVGDILGPSPETYYLRQGVFPGCQWFRVTEAVDRSATAGVVHGRFGKLNPDEYQDKLYRVSNHFRGDTSMFLGGASPAEIKLPGHVISGTSVAVDGTADPDGRIVITPNSTNIAQLNLGGLSAGTASAAGLLPFVLSAGKAIFFRARCNFGVGAVDNSAFIGLSITGAVAANGTVPATDDYLGFFKKVDDDGSLFFATNRDNGTDNLTDTGINTVADTMYDVAFLAVNRVSGDAASATTVYVWVNGSLVATLSSAAVNALINKDEGMNLVFSGIDGAAAVAIELDRWEAAMNLA